MNTKALVQLLFHKFYGDAGNAKLAGNDGFTLMELLVSINLSFIVFVVMLSPYLIT